MSGNTNTPSNAADTAHAGQVFFSASSRIVVSQMAAWAAYLEGLRDQTTAVQNSIAMTVAFGNNQANATKETYNKDADQLIQQSYAQIGQACVGGLQGAVALGSLKGTADAANYSKNMDKLTNDMNEMPKPAAAPAEMGHEDEVLAPKAQVDPAREAALESYRAQLSEKGRFNFDRVAGRGKAGLDQKLDDKGITLREVLNTADEKDLPALRKGVAGQKKLASQALLKRSNDVQFAKSMADSFTQALGSIPQAVFKENEAQAMAEKGKASFEQTLAQNELSMAQQTAKSQGDQFDSLAQAAKSVPRTLGEVARAEYQG